MMTNPRIGQRVQVWYRQGLQTHMPLHGEIGNVVIVSHGKPRNHGVQLKSGTYVIPCGNLRKVANDG
jgi:hypothetical protein